MKNRASILLLVGCSLLSIGCKREAAIPSDSFRVSVQNIITGSDLKVSIVKFHIPHNASIYVDSEHSHSSVSMQDAPQDNAGQSEGQVVLTASRVARDGDEFASIQTLIRLESAHGSAGGPGVSYVPVRTNLDTYFSVIAATGEYKLNTPVTIADLDGKPVTLMVGKPRS